MDTKRLMVLNLGSTSFKFSLYAMGERETLLASGGVESVGGEGAYTLRVSTQKQEGRCACKTHMDALKLCLQLGGELGMPADLGALDAVGYKAVHGGKISGAQVVDGALMAQMDKMVSFAPAHNPVYLAMMRAVAQQHPGVLQIACFETAYHATMPLERVVYGVPYEWVERYGIRRYGFHGSSHSYIAWKIGREAPGAKRVVSVHLGGSSSICAILEGKSVYCSMGATPQSGLFHNNRVGDLDAFVLPALVEELGSLDTVMHTLSTCGGFLGLSGISNDMREVESAATEGNARAALAVSAFEDEIVGYIGMCAAYLGGLDALAFTGGIGINDTGLRARVVKRLSWLGAQIEESKNLRRYEGCISTGESRVSVWSLETNEGLMVARGCMRVLGMMEAKHGNRMADPRL